MSFQALHDAYKDLKRLKSLIKVGGTALVAVDTVDVFLAQWKQLFGSIENEMTVKETSKLEQCRLAAMQLVLHYDYMQVKMDYLLIDERMPDSQVLDGIWKIEDLLCAFDELRLKDEIFFVYYKMLSFLAKVHYSRTKQIKLTKLCLDKAAQMYKHFIANAATLQFYDAKQLFSKSRTLRPMMDGLKSLNDIFVENLELTELIEDNEEFNSVTRTIHWLQRHQALCKVLPLVWLNRLRSLVPLLLGQHQYKSASYCLLIAFRVLNECCSVPNMAEFKSIHTSIALYWIRYTFDVFGLSKDKIFDSFCGNQNRMLLSAVVWKCHDIESNLMRSSDANYSAFQCFEETIRLTDAEKLLCMDSLIDLNETRSLLGYSIKIIATLIEQCAVDVNPTNYIIYHYQLSDLLNIVAILSNDPKIGHTFQRQRLINFEYMISTVKHRCPDIFALISTRLLDEFNEILIDTYTETSHRRALQKCEASNVFTATFGGNGDVKRNLQQQQETKHGLPLKPTLCSGDN